MSSSSTKAEQYKQAGNAAFAKHDLDLALANFTTAIQLDPSIAAYPLNRAAVQLKLGDWAHAEKDATTALELDGGVNLKAWFRRAVARRNLGRLELAKQDLEDAKRHGAGADVDAELALLLQQLGLGAVEPVHRNEKLDTKQSSPPSQAPPPSSTAPTTDRLRAALAKPASSSSSNYSPASAPISSTKTTPARGDDLLNAVSTRRLAKTKEEEPSSTNKTAPIIKSAAAAASSFAAKKEARLVREKEMMIAAARRERDDDASSTTGVGLTTTTMAPVTVTTVSDSSNPTPPVPSTSSPTPVVSGTSPPAPAQTTTTTTTTTTTMSSSAAPPPPQTPAPTSAINSPTALEAHFLALNARQIPRGDPRRYAPLRRLAREHSSSRESERSRSAAGSWRDWMGQAGLTPDLLSEMLGEVVALFPPEPNLDANQEDQPHLEWVLPLLEGLTTCHRWESASLFLEREEREAVKRVLERARRRLDGVAGRWGV